MAVAVPIAAALAAVTVAFTSAPLQLSVDGFRTSNLTQQLVAVTVTVHNRSDHPVTPHFMVTIGGGHPAGFWTPTGSTHAVIGPGGVATFTIRPNVYTWSPAHDAYSAGGRLHDVPECVEHVIAPILDPARHSPDTAQS